MRKLFIAGAVLVAAATAAVGVGTVQAETTRADKPIVIDVRGPGGAVAGKVVFNADPGGGGPGDAIRACDSGGDGWGVTAYLDYKGGDGADRTISTAGHNSPICTGWGEGNIKEGTKVSLWACLVKGSGADYCTNRVSGRA
ncbi:MAG: hypothetical protein ACRD0P_08790 [Stackebrandtia sp.]